MEYFFSSTAPARTRTGCAIAGVYEGGRLSATATALSKACGRRIATAVGAGDIGGKPGETLLLSRLPGLACDRVLLVGLGNPEQLDLKRYRRAVSDAAGVLKRIGARDAVNYLALEPVRGVDMRGRARHAVEALEHTLYRLTGLKTGADRPIALGRFGIVGDRAVREAVEAGVREGAAIAAGVRLTRDLGNLPANICTPSHLAKTARELAKAHRKIEVQVLDAAQMRKLGMNALLAVGQGSVKPSHVAVMQWKGAGAKGGEPLAIVGKGVTFDTGGISLKPAAGMEDMKGDMAGAACVVGLMHELAARKAKVNVVGIVGLVENMPGGNAQRPGDVVTSMSGQTIEVLNTDAEGRMVLADCLWYVQERFKPKAVINLATLTGAVMVALGKEHAGIFSNNNELATRLIAAGNATGERLWRLPLGPKYDKMIDSKVADMKNTGGKWGGSISAAQFLQRFIKEGTPWAHLDIAGTAMSSVDSEINRSWGSGFGVRLLDRLIADQYERR